MNHFQIVNDFLNARSRFEALGYSLELIGSCFVIAKGDENPIFLSDDLRRILGFLECLEFIDKSNIEQESEEDNNGDINQPETISPDN